MIIRINMTSKSVTLVTANSLVSYSNFVIENFVDTIVD